MTVLTRACNSAGPRRLGRCPSSESRSLVGPEENSMRVGLIAPPWVPVPPPLYGGTEVVADNLARALARGGHDVRLFTVGVSSCPVPRQWYYSNPPEPMGSSVAEAAH